MSPHPGWCKRTFTGPRPWENTDVSAFSEVTGKTRGELRLAAEVALAVFTARDVPSFAHERAFQVLEEVARR